MSGMELFGFFGSALVAVSLMMSNLKKLRWINLAGATVFTIYGFLIGAWPVFVLNGWIVLVNIWYLRAMYLSREQFDLIEPDKGLLDPVVKMFLDQYETDIIKIFSDFDRQSDKTARVWLTYRDLKPSGIFIFEKDPDAEDTTLIKLDYVAPEYRDMKNALLIFSRQMSQLENSGSHTLKTRGVALIHQQYLLKLGFKAITGTDMYQLSLQAD